LASVPPKRSVRVLVARERNCRTIEEWEHCSSTPSNPPSTHRAATSAYPATISAISRSSTGFGTSRKSGSATADGAQTGRREYMDDDWPPLWLSWARIGVPCACTASVIRRYPSSTFGLNPWISFSYGQSVGWVECSSVMMRPAPPLARAA